MMGGLLTRSDHLNNCSDATFQQFYCVALVYVIYIYSTEYLVPKFGHFRLRHPLYFPVVGYSYPVVQAPAWLRNSLPTKQSQTFAGLDNLAETHNQKSSRKLPIRSPEREGNTDES